MQLQVEGQMRRMIAQLPRWACVAFAARCARRAQPIFDGSLASGEETRAAAEKAIAGVELVAAKGDGPPCADYHEMVAEAAFAAIMATGHPQPQAWDASFARGYCAAATIVAAAAAAGNERPGLSGGVPNPIRAGNYDGAAVAVMRDLSVIREAALREGWTNETPVSQAFWPLHSEFFTSHPVIEGQSLAQIFTLVQSRILGAVRDPEQLFLLHPRQFEELVAELFDGFGFSVELTQTTRDGGYDIVAVQYRPITTKYLIECKRYARERRVGIVPVRALHGVVCAEDATKGLVVTTSSFTKAAREYIDKHRWVLEGKDFDGLVDWLTQYQRMQLRI